MLLQRRFKRIRRERKDDLSLFARGSVRSEKTKNRISVPFLFIFRAEQCWSKQQVTAAQALILVIPWLTSSRATLSTIPLRTRVWLTLFVRGVVWTLSLALNEPGPCEHSSPSRVLFKPLHAALKLVAVAVAFVQPP